MEHAQILWFMALAVVVAVGFRILAVRHGQRPFRSLTVDHLGGATVEVTPPGTLAILSQQDLRDLVDILQKITIYQEDNSYQASGRQMVTFTLTMVNGTECTVTACNPWLILDGVGYRTSHAPCLGLSTLGHQAIGE